MRVLPLALILLLGLGPASAQAIPVSRYPAHRSSNVAPDTHLILTFDGAPRVGASGKVEVFDADTHALV